MEHEKILKMIEEVDPSDTAKLDEIDARVWCWLGVQGFDEKRNRFDLTFERMKNDKGDGYYYCNGRNNRKLTPKYARSRDALKSIRPKHWCANIDESGRDGNRKWKCVLIHFLSDFVTNCKFLPTEELAELHAIIQAIAHERKTQNED